MSNDAFDEIAAGAESGTIGTPQRILELNTMVSNFLYHAINRGVTLRELRYVAAIFKMEADNLPVTGSADTNQQRSE
jgi:hypothetical protein